MNRTLQQARKKTQRERILAGMIHAVALEGYASSTVAHVIAHAGVSRPTFYEYFEDKNDCFVAALGAVQDQLISEIRGAVGEYPPERAMHAALVTLVDFAHSKPTMARVLLDEAMRGGPRALDVRDKGIRTLQRLIEVRYGADASVPVADVPAGVLIGGIYRLVASRLRSEQPDLARLRQQLLAWSESYALPVSEHRWRALRTVSLPAASSPVESALKAPHAVGPGQVRVSRLEMGENQRQRIVLAAARLAEEKGYAATTILDITTRAGVDNRAFYRLFTDKEEAFSALHELLFRQLMAVTATGFLEGETWPERIWQAGRTFVQYVEENQQLAYAAFVESYAGGAAMVERVEQLLRGFTLFLQVGYQHQLDGDPPSAVALDAIATMVFELDYLQVRESRVDRLSGLLPHVTFIALAPFIGAAAANEFIDRQVEQSREAAHRPPS